MQKLLMKNFACCFAGDAPVTSCRDELQFHIDQQVAENIAAGMSHAETRRAALRTFGNLRPCANKGAMDVELAVAGTVAARPALWSSPAGPDAGVFRRSLFW